MQITKPFENTIVVARSFAASRQAVFSALTSPAEVPLWFTPARMSLAGYEADVRTGGSYRYTFERRNGMRLEMRGVYEEVVAPLRWVYTETYDFSPIQLLVTNTLDDADGQTLLTQTIRYATTKARDDDFDAVAESAADLYGKLDRYLKSGG